jgi:hypothetical protein
VFNCVTCDVYKKQEIETRLKQEANLSYVLTVDDRLLLFGQNGQDTGLNVFKNVLPSR